jgi:HEAT repeat protein
VVGIGDLRRDEAPVKRSARDNVRSPQILCDHAGLEQSKVEFEVTHPALCKIDQAAGKIKQQVEKVVDKVKDALTDMNPQVRQQAYYLLSQIGEDPRSWRTSR